MKKVFLSSLMIAAVSTSLILSSCAKDKNEEITPVNESANTLKASAVQNVTKITAKDVVQIYMYRNAVGNNAPFYSTNTSESGKIKQQLVCNLFPSSSNLNIPSWLGVVVPLHKYYNAKLNKYFFTRDYNFMGSGKNGYVYQGAPVKIFSFATAGTIKSVPLYAHFERGNEDGLPGYFSTQKSVVFSGKNYYYNSNSSTIIGYVPVL